MRLDSHQHFWNYSAAEYPWIPHGSPLQRSWLPPDLARLHEPLGFAGSIAVQARQSVEESRWLLDLSDTHPGILGVVGWVDLQSESVEADLERFAPHPRWVGVRHVVQDEPDDEFLLRPAFQRGIARLRQFNLTYDLLIYPRQLPAAITLVGRFPEQRFVLDHIAKPVIRERRLSPWTDQIRELARNPNVVCKVSGMVTEADPRHWTPADLRPYLDVVFEAFGPRRLMFGSDWPVCLLAADYARVVGVIDDYVQSAGWTAEATEGFWSGNCRRSYRLDAESRSRPVL